MTDTTFSKVEWIVRIRSMEQADVTPLFESFAHHGWHKPAETFRGYLDDQRHGVRACYVAEVGGAIAGCCTLLWESPYAPFNTAGIPEIAELNVLPPYRAVTVSAVRCSTPSRVLPVRVVQGSGWAMAFTPITAEHSDYTYAVVTCLTAAASCKYRAVEPGQSIPIDDDATLMLTRALRN